MENGGPADQILSVVSDALFSIHRVQTGTHHSVLVIGLNVQIQHISHSDRNEIIVTKMSTSIQTELVRLCTPEPP